MRGSHAPSLRTLVRRTLRDEVRVSKDEHLLVACSGGPDSMALLNVLASLRAELRLELSALGVDHGLRSEALAELSLAEALARRLGVPFELVRLAVPAGGNLMARAREARYQALEAARARVGATLIATGHTADDRAETVLLRLLSFGGLRGLAVLPARDGARARPLVRATRADVVRHLEQNRLAAAADPSNLDTRFARVRVRTELLPRLAELSPRIVETLCALADELIALGLAPEARGASPLGRRQRAVLQRQMANAGRGRVRLGESEELLAELVSGELVLKSVASKRERRASPAARSAGKPRKEEPR